MEIVLNDFGLEWKRKDGIVHKADYDDLIKAYEKQMQRELEEDLEKVNKNEYMGN